MAGPVTSTKTTDLPTDTRHDIPIDTSAAAARGVIPPRSSVPGNWLTDLPQETRGAFEQLRLHQYTTESKQDPIFSDEKRAEATGEPRLYFGEVDDAIAFSHLTDPQLEMVHAIRENRNNVPIGMRAT